MSWSRHSAVALAMLALGGCVSAPHQTAIPPPEAATSQPTLPGRKPDGSVLLPNQWSLRPAGGQLELGDFPVNVAIHPGGRFAAVLHSGDSLHQILVIDLRSASVFSRTNLHETFYGLEFSKDGKELFCSGAGDEVVHRFDFQEGRLLNHRKLELHDRSYRAVPAGLALNSSASQLWTANVWGNGVTRVDLTPETRTSDILLGTDSPKFTPASSDADSESDNAAANKRAESAAQPSDPNATFPYACRLDEKRRRLYVSLWAQAAVAVVDTDSSRVLARWPTEEHPCEMALTRSGKFLFVANSARNSVTVFDTDSGKALETICAALYPQAPPGSTPNSLALSPDERTLFIANADNNSVAVFDVSSPGKSVSLGFIPVGWYPTSVRVAPNGKHLLVANGKGLTSMPNSRGPIPGVTESKDPKVQYIARLFRGSLSIIDLPSRAKFRRQLAAYTAQAYRCTPLKPNAGVQGVRPTNSPVPFVAGIHEDSATPIKYVFYIVKENRTYDQVLGDMPEGNGDAKLCLFPERVTPNHHKLAREFVLLDNFYVDAEVSADGHEWSMGAYATDFVEKMWPMNYGHNSSKKFPYPAEGYFPIATPAGGYLWDRAKAAGISYRSYGEFVQNGATLEAPCISRVAALRGHIDEGYRGFDLSYADTNRSARFLAELKRLEAEGDMPRLQILRLPGDHTHGSTRNFRTPTAYVGDNDLALGQIIDALTHSRFWPQMAVFIVEDDAQNGPDHVDAHRTIAYVISPYAKRAAVDSTMYSTSSMLRTIELILGLKPMSQFDAAATPMFNAFQPVPDLRPYQGLPVNVNLDERNKPLAWGGNLDMDFAKEDAADDILLNETVWRSVRGPDHPMPAPVRAAFVFAHPKDADDD